MDNEWLEQSAADLGRGIDRGEIDPVELTQTFLRAIETHELGGKVYARTTPDRALAEAEAAKIRANQGIRLSPLDGVPISWKDLFDTAGVATEAGSKMLEGRVPDQDALVLQNANAAGLVCLGKTHMTELAFSGLGLNPVTETPPCVNDGQAVPGGSSSGAGASVAYGLAAAAVGSDTGGSVRIPSVWNDLVGLKTTSGLISLDGVVPLAASLDTVGPLCRTVEDCALMLSAFLGRTPGDLTGATLKGQRFLVLENGLDGARAEPLAGFSNALERIEAAGAVTEHRSLPCVEAALDLAGILMGTETYATWAPIIEAGEDKMFFQVRERFLAGKTTLGYEYVQALQELDRLRGEWTRAVAGYDAVILPTSLILPPNIERLLTDNDYYVSENLLSVRNTKIGNLLGLSSLTIPTGVPSTGIMFFTPPLAESRLLRIGAAAEAALA